MKSKFEYRQEFFEGLPHGPENAKGIRRAIDAALEQNDITNALSLYYDYLRENSFYDDAYQGLIVFPEYLTLFENHPEFWDRFEHDMMWAYKWTSHHYRYFYQIPREQIEEMLKNYASFCDRFNYNKRTYYQAIFYTLDAIGPHETLNGLTMSECYRLMNKTTRDSLSDCQACSLDNQVTYTLFYDDDLERALKLARPLFVGTMSCTEVPHITYANFSKYYLEKGGLKEAEEYADKSWRLINRRISTTTSLADYKGYILLSYAYTNRRKGISVFKKTFPYCWDMKNSVFSWKYYYGAYHLMLQLEQAGSKRITFIFPDKSVDFLNDKNTYSITDLKGYMYNKLKFLSDKLDERDGNTMYNDRLSVKYKSTDSE